jgi:hypothetical protein
VAASFRVGDDPPGGDGKRYAVFAGVIRASCRWTRNLGYFAIPQAWFSTGDAKPVRDLMRDLERVNRGEP